MEEKLQKKSSRVPYLYQKGRSIYYRWITPRNAVGLPSGKEIRVCLHTCKMREARNTIALLHAHVLQKIADLESAGCKDNSEASQLTAMKKWKDELNTKVDAVLRSDNKVSLSQSEIKERLLARLVKQLDQEEFEPCERYKITKRDPDGQITEIVEEEIWAQEAKNITKRGCQFPDDMAHFLLPHQA